jgi:hypothetical protein
MLNLLRCFHLRLYRYLLDHLHQFQLQLFLQLVLPKYLTIFQLADLLLRHLTQPDPMKLELRLQRLLQP